MVEILKNLNYADKHIKKNIIDCKEYLKNNPFCEDYIRKDLEISISRYEMARIKIKQLKRLLEGCCGDHLEDR